MDVFALMDVPEFCPGYNVIKAVFQYVNYDGAVTGLLRGGGMLQEEIKDGGQPRVGFYDVGGEVDVLIDYDMVVDGVDEGGKCIRR